MIIGLSTDSSNQSELNLQVFKTADGSLISSDAEKAFVLNQYFASVFISEGHFSPPTLQPPYPIQNSLARAVVKSTHITPILKSLHWLKVNERIEYKLLSLIYKVLTTAQPSYLHNLISLQPFRSTRSSSVVTLSRPPTISSLKITDRSFRYASPRLWNSRFIPSASPFSS